MNRSKSRIHSDWGILVGESHRLGDRSFRQEALTFARRLCEVARANIEMLIQDLEQSGYVFARRLPFEPPETTSLDWILEFEQKGVFLPIFLQAWILEVGCVDLAGTHPSWPHTAYCSEGRSTHDVWCTDPLSIETSREHLSGEYDEWVCLCQEDGPNAVGPFRLSIAGDHLHKANISGGPPYTIDTQRPCVDTLLLNARDGTSLFYHVSNALYWGGFPGFVYIDDDPPAPIPALRKRLHPL